MQRKMSLIIVGMLVLSGIAGALILGPEVGEATGLENSAWPCYGHDNKHTGQSAYETGQVNGTEKWSYKTGGSVRSSPVIGKDGTIYVGSDDGNLYALNPDGTEKWSFSTGDNIRSSPAFASSGRIYVGSYDDHLYAVNPNGTKVWSFDTGKDVRASPVIGDDGTIYVSSTDGSSEGTLYSIDPDGTEKWNFTTGSSVISSPTIGGDGTIYVGSSSLYAINPNGTRQWEFNLGSWSHSPPVINDNGMIYVNTLNNLFAIYPNGTKKWNNRIVGSSTLSIAISSRSTVYAASSYGSLYEIKSNGSESWGEGVGFKFANYTNYSGYTLMAIDSSETIYLVYDNDLYAIGSGESNNIFWNFSTGDKVYSSPAIGSEGTIYFGSDDGNLYAIGASDDDKNNDDNNDGGGGDTPGFTFPLVLISVFVAVIYQRRKKR